MFPSSVKIIFEPRDLWIGVYWNRVKTAPRYLYYGIERFQDVKWATDKVLMASGENSLTIYICVIPMLPLRIRWEW